MQGLFGETCTTRELPGCNMEKLLRGKPTDTKPCWQRLDVGKRRMVEQLVAHWVENQALPEARLNLLAAVFTESVNYPMCLFVKWPQVY